MSDIFPIVMTAAGAQPTSPQVLRDQLVALAVAQSPGLTADLPGALIEDIASTDVGALTVADSARVDLINSVTPYGANEFLLNQLGQIYGVQQGVGSNGSVNVVFDGPAGYVIARGFMVGDGTNQYIVQDGGIIPTGGVSDPLYSVAVQSGVFSIPANTVTQILTNVPSAVTLTCNNPTDGLPQIDPQSPQEYRAQVLQKGNSPSVGVPTYTKSLIAAVAGVQSRLISIQSSGSQWNVIVGGGDPYQVAYAIYSGILDPNTLAPSVLLATAITNANPGVLTTNIPHGFTNGQTITITGATGMTGINGSHTATVIDATSFSFGVNTTSSGAYTTNSATITPNLRNVSVSINDYPDSYTIPFIIPLAQTVTLTFTWNTNSTNFVSATAVAALANPAIVNYINSIPTGQPINLFEMQDVFKQAIVSLIDPALISRMVIAVDINGVPTSPTSGTGIIPGFAQSYFSAVTSGVVVTQG